MNPLPQNPARSFFWQGVLILLPVAVLAAVRLHSFGRDRATIRQEAAAQAQATANELLRNIWGILTPGPKMLHFTEIPYFLVEPNGSLSSPTPYAPVPTPRPMDVTLLGPETARLWQAAQQAEP